MSYTISKPRPKLSRCLLFASLFFLAFFAPAASAQDGTPAVGPSDFFTHVIANQKKSEISLDEFERTQRVEKRRTASDPTPSNTTVWRLFPAGPGTGKIVLSMDNQPTDAAIYLSELEKLEKYLGWAVQDGLAQKDAGAKAERKRKERFELLDTTHQAFRFRFEGKELRGERTLLRYSMVPNPDYHPTSRNTVLFTRVRGTIWIDEQDSELAKVEGSVTEDFSIALFLAKVYKGSHFMQERYEVAPGVWEPTFEQYDFDGRKVMVPFAIHERTFYSDYKHVGPPKESIQVVRAELNNLQAERSSH
jgi:hypothetical protein